MAQLVQQRVANSPMPKGSESSSLSVSASSGREIRKRSSGKRRFLDKVSCEAAHRVERQGREDIRVSLPGVRPVAHDE